VNGSSGQIAWFADIAAPGGNCLFNSAINFYVSEDGSSSDRTYVRECGRTYQDNQWHLFTGVFKPGNFIKLYIDGVSKGSVSGTSATVNMLRAIPSVLSGAKIIGYALETGATGDTILMDMNIHSNGGVL